MIVGFVIVEKYRFMTLMALAILLAVTYVILYIEAGLTETSDFVNKIYLLLAGVLYSAAVLMMSNYGNIGWLLYILALALSIAISIVMSGIWGMPMVFVSVFIVMYLLSEDVRDSFGVHLRSNKNL